MKRILSFALASTMVFSSFVTASAAQLTAVPSQNDAVTYLSTESPLATDDTPASPDEPEVDMVTYYFLAPDNYFRTDAGAVNSNVGYYYWDNGGNGSWPGQAATPAPEVHPNAFKVEVPNNDYVSTIIFNALVDAGSPADPELAAAAHQTKNIDVEEDNYDGMIYVLDLTKSEVNDFSGAITTGGEWFTLDTFKDSANYATYDFSAMATYYFLAPDNYFKTEAGAVNTDVGYYYWENGGNGNWPGQAATPAPEVHPNAFKIEIPNNDYIGTIIFNALVDAGSPADPELAAAAHQTKNIDVEADDYNGMIYVLDLTKSEVNDFSGAITTGGEWFTLETFKDSENYATYNFAEEPTEKQYKAGDTVRVDLLVGNVDSLGSISARIFYDPEYLKLESGLADSSDTNIPKVLVNEKTAGTINVGALYDAKKGTNAFAGEKAVLCTLTFTALKDFNEKDLGISDIIVKIAQIKNDSKDVDIIVDKVKNENVYTELLTTINGDPDVPTPVLTKKVKIGDVDENGEITSGDSLSILRASVGLETVDTRIADIDKSDKIDSGDSLAVLRASVKLFDASNEIVGTEIEIPVD